MYAHSGWAIERNGGFGLPNFYFPTSLILTMSILHVPSFIKHMPILAKILLKERSTYSFLEERFHKKTLCLQHNNLQTTLIPPTFLRLAPMLYAHTYTHTNVMHTHSPAPFSSLVLTPVALFLSPSLLPSSSIPYMCTNIYIYCACLWVSLGTVYRYILIEIGWYMHLL